MKTTIKASAAAALAKKIEALPRGGESVIVAVDGRCASGKTTMAAELERLLGCAVFHMDDYFPRPEQRTPERLAAPGGNIDCERFLEEVLLPLRSGAKEIIFRPFDCRRLCLGEPVAVKSTPIAVVEGSYSCHPLLWEHYGLRVFMTVDPEEQLRRIALRGGEALRAFRERWIPMEEKYFAAFGIAERCDVIIE